jgi:hypothetical protein
LVTDKFKSLERFIEKLFDTTPKNSDSANSVHSSIDKIEPSTIEEGKLDDNTSNQGSATLS